MRRREFLVQSGRAAFGSCLFPVAARAQESPTNTTSKVRTSQNLITELEKLIPKLMGEAVVPGLSIALVEDGKLLWHRGFGVKDNSTAKPVDDETVFEAASVSKTLFAYAVVQLSQWHSLGLGLDTPLTHLAPKPFLVGDPRLELITARHVLSHTSGFQDWRSKAKPLKIHFRPGEKFLYSGEGYHYLQWVMSHVTGHINPVICAKYEADFEVCATDFDSHMKTNLLNPFGMRSSGYVWNENLEQHAARPHDAQGKPSAKKKPTATDAARYGAAGGLHTTALDYAKFLVQLFNPKDDDAFRISRKATNEMLRPHVTLNEGEKIDGADSWALGWAIQKRKSGHIILHSGGQDGFRSLTMAAVERKCGFVILTNGDNGGRLLYDRVLGDALNRLLEGHG